MRYPVTLTRDSNDTYLATFPDVPGANTFGDTVEEALEHARDALLSVFDSYVKDRMDIPLPSTVAEGQYVVAVPALESSKLMLYRYMRAQRMNKASLARLLKWHAPQVDRVLDVRHGSQLEHIEAAFGALGKRLEVTVHDAPMTVHPGVIVAAKRKAVRRRTAPGAAKKR